METPNTYAPKYPGRPSCFRGYDDRSEFCRKVCRHSEDCADPAYKAPEIAPEDKDTPQAEI